MSVGWHVRDLPWLGNRGDRRHWRPFIAERRLKGCVVIMEQVGERITDAVSEVG
jgi:hypothetical protein